MGEPMFLGSGNKVVTGSSAKESSNEWLGLKNKRVNTGTVSAREAMTLGGEESKGELFHGASVGGPSREMNSIRGEKKASNDEALGAAAKYALGTVGARNTKADKMAGGKTALGEYVGRDAKSQAGKLNAKSVIDAGKSQPGMDLLSGTSDWQKNMDRAMRGLGGTKSGKRTRQE